MPLTSPALTLHALSLPFPDPAGTLHAALEVYRQQQQRLELLGPDHSQASWGGGGLKHGPDLAGPQLGKCGWHPTGCLVLTLLLL